MEYSDDLTHVLKGFLSFWLLGDKVGSRWTPAVAVFRLRYSGWPRVQCWNVIRFWTYLVLRAYRNC